MLHAVAPFTQEKVNFTFSQEGLKRLKHGLDQIGRDPKHFPWSPVSDPNRAPYHGLKPLEGDDAGIFFGPDAALAFRCRKQAS
jgi:hypothetical protein